MIKAIALSLIHVIGGAYFFRRKLLFRARCHDAFWSCVFLVTRVSKWIPNNTGSRSRIRIFLSDADSGCPVG